MFYKDVFIYSFWRQKQRENSSICLAHCPHSYNTQGSGQIPEKGTPFHSPAWLARPQVSGTSSPVFPGITTGSWTVKEAGRIQTGTSLQDASTSNDVLPCSPQHWQLCWTHFIIVTMVGSFQTLKIACYQLQKDYNDPNMNFYITYNEFF